VAAVRGLARTHVRAGKGAEALTVLKDAAGARPEAVILLLDIAALHQQAGNTAEAEAAYRRALARDDANPIALNNLAYLLGRDRQHLAEALELAERAYERAPRNAAIADTLGWLLHKAGDDARALPLLEQAARGAPDNAEVQYHLGAVLAAKGRTAEARAALERALQGPPFPDAPAARRLLDSLR
jgi:cellulose synthase operon protein C